MAWYVWTLVPLALLVSAVVGVQAYRHPILFKMAARNAARRPQQTTTVIAGLMIGTAIISASLVAGQSAGGAIEGTVYEALGDVDETVRLDGFSFFDEDVLDAYLADPTVTDHFDGISANLIWGAAADHDRTDLFEPDVAIVGYDPERDRDFRPFEFADGTTSDGTELQPGQAIINQELADALEAEAGDTIRIRYTDPVDPHIPDIHLFNGTLTAAGGGAASNTQPLPVDSPETGTPADNASDPNVATHHIPVDEGAVRFIAAVGWQPSPVPAEDTPPTTQFTLRLVSPDGDTWVAPDPQDPDTDSPGVEWPLFIDVEADGTPLAAGNWTIEVSAVVSTETPYIGAGIPVYPVYDISELQDRSRDLENFEGDGFTDTLTGGFDPFGELKSANVTIASVTTGGRGVQFDLDATIFMRLDDTQQMFDRDREVNVIKFSNPGDIVEGRAGTATAMAILESRLEQIKADHPFDPAIQELKVFDVKDKFLQLADDAGATFTSLLLFAGSLSVITGLLLIINIFTMLAEERRSELGMARAVGLTRSDLVRLFLFEGSLYAVAAAAIGSVLGLGLAAILVWGLNVVVSNLGSEFPPIAFSFDFGLLLAAFAAGALLTFITIAQSSRRIARLNIVRAIRQIDEPEKAGRRIVALAGLPIAILGVLATTAGWFRAPAVGGFSLQILGALVVVLGTGMALKRTVARKRLYPMLAAALTIYYAITYFVIGEFDELSEANVIGPLRGVILTLAVVVMVIHWERLPRMLGRAMNRIKKLRAVALPAFSYPQHKRFRTGMTLAMFSIVILSIGFFSIFGGLFDRPVETQTGGFHVEATTTLDVPNLDLYDKGLIPEGIITDQAEIRYFSTRDVELITVSGEKTGHFGPPRHIVFGYEQDFADAQNFRLLWRTDDYATDAEAYQAVLERDDVVIVSYQYSTDEQARDLSHEVGETLQLHVGDEPKEFTIIGIQEQYHLPGIFLHRQLVEDLFPTSDNNFYLYKLADGVDHEETAKLLERNYRDVGMNAEASEVQVAEEQEAFRQILGAMKLFLGLGLIVGVLSLGIVTARSVIERRQEIGMLRALGYTKNMIRRIFVTEMTFTVALGAIIGVACSILVSFGLWFAIIRELQYPYSIPWGEILTLIGISYGVALLATFAPIRRASRVAPAEALRYIE